MRLIGELPKGPDPRVLEDHLLGLGMKTRFDRRPDGGSVVWIINEDHVDRAKKEVQEFLAAPDDPRFRASAPKAKEARKKEAAKEREYRKNFRYASNLWAAPTFARRPVTVIVVAISVALYILMNFTQFGLQALMALSFFDLRNGLPEHRPNEGLADILGGQVWRLVTPIFLHFSPLHILFNGTMMMRLGTGLELKRGSRRLLAMIVVSAIFSNLAQYAWMERMPADPEELTKFHIFGGLSGVLYALLGYAWMMGECHPEEGVSLDSRNTTWMLFWLVLCFTGYVGNIANAAHVGGLVIGMVMGIAKL